MDDTGEINAGQPRLTYRPDLDGIRGIAILLVVLQHFVFSGDLGSRVGALGAVGVTLFFVLSGYLITSLLLVEERVSGRIDLRAFYVRRLRRLFPALAGLVVVAFVLGWPGIPALAITYTSNLADRLQVDMGYLTHTWTLAIEEQFYLVWPLAFTVLVRWPRALPITLISAGLASIVFRYEIGNLLRADALAAGCLLALWGRRLPRWAGLAGWLGLAASCLVLDSPPAWLWTVAMLTSALIVGSGGFVTARPLVWLGTISYGLYLWHYPIAQLVVGAVKETSGVGLAAGLLGGMAVSVAIAMASARWIERPFRVRRVAPRPTFQAVPVAAD